MSGWVVETLLATTLLMLAVLALRGPVRRAFGSSVAYALWALPLLRMMLPPLPGDWQLTGLVAPLLAPAARSGVIVGVMNADRMPTEVAGHAMATVEVVMADGPVRAALIPPVVSDNGPSVLALVLGLWAVGVLAFLIYQLVSYRRFCTRIERQARRRRRVAGDRVELIETDAATGPLAFGIWRKVVAFPSDFADRYDEDERDLALAHELTHHARGDLIANWAALVVLGIHWFNPIAWRAFRAFRADQEMACDERVLAGKGPAFAHAYGRAIVKSAHGGAISAACHLHTINDLKGRLRMLSTNRKSRRRLMAGSAGVLALAVTSLALTASGTQAAERLGITAPKPPVAPGRSVEAPTAPIAPLAPLAPTTELAPIAPLPPQSATEPAAPPAPPTPPEAPETEVTTEKKVIVVQGEDGKKHKPIKVIIRRANGKLQTEDFRGMEIDIPEVAELNCGKGQGDEKQTVLHDEKNGKKRIIICTNRIEKMVAAGVTVALNSAEIERNAYRQALSGLRNARSGMVGKGNANPEALKAIDEAIAEVEADLAKVQ